MHRIDTDGHVANQFNEGDPLVPRNPTQVDKHWLNAVQEEIVNIILDAGITLVKGTNTQLGAAIAKKASRAYGVIDVASGVPTVMADAFNIASVSIQGSNRLRVTFTTALQNRPTISVTPAWTSSGSTPADPLTVVPINEGAAPWTFAEFYIYGNTGSSPIDPGTLAARRFNVDVKSLG